MKNIICPNCGAENSHYGKCEYCGSSIKKPQNTTTAQKYNAEAFAQKIAKYHKIEPFEGGVAIVSIGKQYGAINEQGDLIIPLTSYNLNNYDGRILVYSEKKKILDFNGKVLAEADRIEYIEQGNFLLEEADGKTELFKNNNERIAVDLPKGIHFYEPLGDGYYIVCNLQRKYYQHGIATMYKLLLPLEYCSNFVRFPNDNNNLVVIQKRDHHKMSSYSGIFNLETQRIILPCQYSIPEQIRDLRIDGNLLIINRFNKNYGYEYGVFDLKLEDFVIPMTKCRNINALGERRFQIIKDRFWGWKKEIIQL